MLLFSYGISSPFKNIQYCLEVSVADHVVKDPGKYDRDPDSNYDRDMDLGKYERDPDSHYDRDMDPGKYDRDPDSNDDRNMEPGKYDREPDSNY